MKKLTILTLLIIFITLVALNCEEDKLPIYNKRGDDGRELIYESEESWVVWPHHVTLSSDTSEIAFNIRQDGYDLDGIVILNISANETRVLLDEDAFNPKWSSSGEWIAFNTYRGPGTFWSVYLIRPDGSDMKPAVATYDNEEGQDWFGNDDKLVVINSINSEYSEKIQVYDIESDSYETIKTYGMDEDCHNHRVVVSPDDDWLALTQTVRANEIPLAYMRTDGSNYYVDFRDTSNQYCIVDWSPDGRYILFSLFTPFSEFNDRELWTYEVKTGKLTQLTMAREGYYVPNPPFENGITSEEITDADWGTDGYIYFAANGNLYRIKGPA